MHSLLRFSLLGVCAAGGVGLAVGLALTVAPQEGPSPAEQVSRAFRPEEDAAPRKKPAPEPERKEENTPLAQHFPPAPQPIIVPTYPPVSQDFGNLMNLQNTLDQLRQATQRQTEALEGIVNDNRDRTDGLPPNTVAPLPAPAATDPPSPDPAIVQQPDSVQPVEPLATPPAGAARVGTRALIKRGEGDNELSIDAKNADIRGLLEMISGELGINILTSKNVTGTVSASFVNVDIDSALAAVLKSTGFIARREGQFVFVGTPADLEEMDRTQDAIHTRVYRPNYVRASELQALITPMLSQAVGRISVSSTAEIDIPADTVKTGGNGFAGTDVVIVRDYEMVLRQIDQLICEIDTKPTQVVIEAMILSVKLDDEYEFGVDFQLLRDQNNTRLVSGAPLANLAQFNLTGDGMRFGFLDASTAVFINALETIGETNVVAAPRILCLNKQRAEILIGSQLGYVSTTVTENASTQSIEFLEVGTQLRIRPFISSDGTIRLEVHPELSTGNVRVESGFTLPDKEVTQVTTNVMCLDGSTVIIGGLIREDLTNNTTQIPFLGSLPYVGPAFRQKLEGNSKHEIIVLITPRLVSEPALTGEGRQAQREFAVRQANYADKMSPIAKRHYARHYLRLAYAAWNAGDGRTALRYSNLAVHFDPMNLEANNLRSEVAGTMPEVDNPLHNYLKDGLRPGQRPVKDYTKRGFPWSPGNPPEEELAPVVDAYDPGVPGRSFDLDPGPPALRKLEP